MGEHPEQAAGLLASAWRERKDIDGLILAGLPLREPWLDALVNRFHRQNRIGLENRASDGLRLSQVVSTDL